MTRIWTAVAASLTVALILAGLVVLALVGPVRDHWMMGGAAPDREDDAGLAMAGPAHMGAVAQSEYDYLVEMIAHHQEAIAAGKQLSRSDRPQVRSFGAGIVATQSAQVEQMTGWLGSWYPDRPLEDTGYVPEMRDLAGLSGDRLDRAFLTDMIGHHMMAVMSSQRLLAMGQVEHDEVADLARTIRDDQRREIHQMRGWLGRHDDAGSMFQPHRVGMHR